MSDTTSSKSFIIAFTLLIVALIFWFFPNSFINQARDFWVMTASAVVFALGRFFKF